MNENQTKTENINEQNNNSENVNTNESNMNQGNTLNGVSEAQSSESVPTEVGQVAQKRTQVYNKEKSHWTFIIAVFTFVGLFVVLLPLLVRIFGY